MMKFKSKLFEKILKIIIEVIPIIIMLVLIPLIGDDYLLAGIFVLIIAISFIIKYEKKDLLFLIFGFIAMTLAEAFFLKTKVEIFNRNTLFDIMPLWLPFLWGYAFVAMKRAIEVLK